MKYIFLLIVLVISSCDTSKKTESISIGTKKTEFIEIKDFPNNLKAKNIILAIGDGVGPNQITLSRIAIGGLDHRLFIDQIPYVGTSLTHSLTMHIQTQQQHQQHCQLDTKQKIDICRWIRTKKY